MRLNMEHNVSIRPIEVTEEALGELHRYLNVVFPKATKFTPDFVKWQYTLNPLGVMSGYNAWDGNRIVAHFAGLPLTMDLFGKVCKGLLIINVSSDPAYRRQKLFTRVGEHTIQQAKDTGYDFLIGAANANSIHTFIKYLGFYLISPLTVKVGFGAQIYTDKEFNCNRLWDDAQWSWRLQNPANKYLYFKNNILSTPVSFFAKTLSKAQINYTADKQLRIKNYAGLRLLNLYIGLGADTSKGFYFKLPSFIKHSPFNLIFQDLTGNIPVIKKEDICFQLIDFDVI